ncbi:MAG: hypothetical protein AVO33_10300 [delta proteobacterium ML8_F1]|nr:MAG: hypothetical protein AVO33_10300 [delta proteobacterium ML8_F1]
MQTVLFDLDGTLLAADQETFLKAYFEIMAESAVKHQIDPKPLIETIWTGTRAMVANDGNRTNEVVFWELFNRHYPGDSDKARDMLDEFYIKDFPRVGKTATPHPLALKCVALLKEKGYQVALATNPLFPRIATEYRIRWAGLSPRHFAHITTYENSSYSKPNLAYYRELLASLGSEPATALMVGNDVAEDMVVESMGMKTFLLTDHLINPGAVDIGRFPRGGFEELYQMIEGLPFLE